METWKMNAYAAAKKRFDLKAKQRDQLDTSEHYEAIMQAAHAQNWDAAEKLLIKAGIIRFYF